MNQLVVEPATRPLSGRVAMPGDKSIGHRSLILAALGEGVSEITGLSGGADNRATAAAVRALGASIEGGTALRVTGCGVDGLSPAAGIIDCGNSGTSIRLLAGLLAGQPFDSWLDGDESLRRRPMRRVADPIGRMGGEISGLSGPRDGEIYPPLAIRGAWLRGIHYDSPIASAQVKSAILLASLYSAGTTSVTEPRISRDHTERMLGALGVPIDIVGTTVTVHGEAWDRALPANHYQVPGDPSSAAFIVVAGLCAGADPIRIDGVCANPTRTGFIDVLEAMGAPLEVVPTETSGAEPRSDLIVTGGRVAELRSTRIAAELTVRAIDELPILAVAAALAEGVTEICDAAELRFKESDRVATTAAMLRCFGVEVEVRADGLAISGRAGAPLSACDVDAAGDHRIAMAAAVAGLAAAGPVRVNNAANVATSFPEFAALLRSLGAAVDEG